MRYLNPSTTRLFLCALIALGVSACNLGDDESDNAATNNQPQSCTDGDTQIGCECPDGELGFQVCTDGQFGGDCQCDEATTNVCGGSSQLTYDGEVVEQLGGSCGPCDDGQIACSGTEAVDCFGASSSDSCPDLPTNQEQPNQEQPNQEQPNQEQPNQEQPNQEQPNQEQPNICGGFSDITYDGEPVTELGGSCGPCDDGSIDCDGEDQVQCTGASPASTCQPTATLEIDIERDQFSTFPSDSKLTVALLEDFTADCEDALSSMSDAAILRPIDGIDLEDNPTIAVTAEELPVDTSYTVVAAAHGTRGDDVTVATSLGCETIDPLEDGENRQIGPILLRELPSELADSYRFSFQPRLNSDTSFFRAEFVEFITELDFRNEYIGDRLLRCWSNHTANCTGSSRRGAIPYVFSAWDDVEPFTNSFGSAGFDLDDKVLELLNGSDDLTGGESHLFYVFEVALDKRWNQMASGSYNNPSLTIGEETLFSLASINVEIIASPEFSSSWTVDPPVAPTAYRVNTVFENSELRWTWAQQYSNCFDSNDQPTIDNSDCPTDSITAADVSWASLGDAEIRLSTIGWPYSALQSVTFNWPLHDLIDHIWASKLQEATSILSSVSGGDFFGSLFQCNTLEATMRDTYQEWRADGVFDYNDNALETLLTRWRPFCEQFQNHGEDFFAAAFKAFALDLQSSQGTGKVPIELLDETGHQIEDRLMWNMEPEQYTSSSSAWLRPRLDHIEPDFSDCAHWFVGPVTGGEPFNFCVVPEIQALD